MTTSPGAPSPAQPTRAALFFDELSTKIVQYHQLGRHPDSMLQMMDCFVAAPPTGNVETNNSPQPTQKCFYYEFSPSMSLRRTVSVNSKTSFSDENFEEINHGRNFYGSEAQISTCKQNLCTILTDHDEAYACWYPKPVAHGRE